MRRPNIDRMRKVNRAAWPPLHMWVIPDFDPMTEEEWQTEIGRAMSCDARLATVSTHTRIADPTIGPPFCNECSQAISEWVERVEALADEWDEAGQEAAAYQNRAHHSEIHEVMAEARWFPARAAELRAEIAALRAADAPLSDEATP